MSSYFVNSLATCYGGGGGPQDTEARDYTQPASPYRAYTAVNSPGPYPYNSASPSPAQNGDYYNLSPRLSHPPIRDTTPGSPPGHNRNMPGYGPPASTHLDAHHRGYNNTTPSSSTTSTNNNNSSQQVPQNLTINSNSSSAPPTSSTSNNNTSATPLPTSPSSTSPPPSNASSSKGPDSPVGSPDGGGSSSGASQSGASSTTQVPSQTSVTPTIYPWMRRMHLGHGEYSYMVSLISLLTRKISLRFCQVATNCVIVNILCAWIPFYLFLSTCLNDHKFSGRFSI